MEATAETVVVRVPAKTTIINTIDTTNAVRIAVTEEQKSFCI
jgi:hypothetical protein